MTVTTEQGISVQVETTYGRPFIVIDIPSPLWEGNPGIDHPNNQRHFAGTLVINGVPMHLEALQVEEVGGLQTANAAEYAEDLNAMYQITGADGPLMTSPAIEEGQQFVLYATPHTD